MSLRQEMFTKTVNHLRQQGNPWGQWNKREWGFVHPDDPCKRCAQGIHMDVSRKYNYKKGRFTYQVDAMAYYKKLEEHEDKELQNMMLDLQDVFEFKNPKTWEKEFIKLAIQYHVTLPSRFSVTTKQNAEIK